MTKHVKVTLTKDELVEAATDYLKKKKEIPSNFRPTGDVILTNSGLTVTLSGSNEPSKVTEIKDAVVK